MAFLRTLKEGMWKCENEGDEKHAWEESVKLRERMFWCRIGGGVIPAFAQKESARNSEESLTAGGLRPASDGAFRDARSPIITGYGVPVKLEVPKKRISKELPPIIVREKQISEATSPIDKELPPPPALPLPEDTAIGEEGANVERKESDKVNEFGRGPATPEPGMSMVRESKLPIVEIAKAPEYDDTTPENGAASAPITTPHPGSGITDVVLRSR
jgi:hypothetical protein